MMQPGSDKKQNEGQRLRVVAIPQQFAWTGLSSKPSDNHDSASFAAAFGSEGLVLWHVLGFALDESNYLSLMLVRKDWKKTVTSLTPPAIFKMAHRMDQSSLLEEDDVELLTIVFNSFQNRESPLYRNLPGSSSEENKEGSHQRYQAPGMREWPYLQPQFNVTLMRFVYALCTQREPQNHSQVVYSLTTSFLVSLTQATIDNLRNIIMMPESASPFDVIDQLLVLWYAWEGIVARVDEITNYVNRYYVRHHALSEFKEGAERAMSRCLVESFRDEYGVARLLSLLKEMRLMATRQELMIDRKDQELLLLAWCVCRRISGNVASLEAEMLRPLASVAEEYNILVIVLELLKQAQEEDASPTEAEIVHTESGTEKPITFVTSDMQKYPFPVSSAFVTSSGFLRKLHLRAGDLVKLNASSAMVEKSSSFFARHEVEPFPGIETPLQSSRLSDLVGEWYADFAETLPEQALFELVTFANLMDFKILLDLCCCQVNFIIKGKSAGEIREMLNIQNK